MTSREDELNFDLGELVDAETGKRFDPYEACRTYERDPERWNTPWPKHDPGDPLTRLVCTDGPWWRH